MGLFKRDSPRKRNDIATLRDELDEMNARLDASEQIRRLLEERFKALDATTASLAERTGALDHVTERMAEVEVLKRQVAQLDVVNAKISSLDGLNGKLTELAERVAISSDDARQAKDQAASLHERISNVSTELANQLGELSREIDVLAADGAANSRVADKQAPTSAMPPPAPIFEPSQTMPTELVDQLRHSQVRLANEQARYEIAFRQDLAMLAEQVRRSRTQPPAE